MESHGLPDAIDEGVFDVLIAEFLSAEAHSVGVGGGGKSLAQCFDERFVHPAEKYGRLREKCHSCFAHRGVDRAVAFEKRQTI